MLGIVDSNGKPIKHPELTEEELKQIAESLDEKYGPLSIESTLNFFEFVDMWKRNFGELLDKTPEVGYAKVVHGEWIRPTKINGRTFDIPHCSVCGNVPCDTKKLLSELRCAHEKRRRTLLAPKEKRRRLSLYWKKPSFYLLLLLSRMPQLRDT